MKLRFKEYLPLVISILIFLALLLPFFGTLPYLDGAIDVVKINDFRTGGFPQLFNNWTSVHPPFKVILGSTFFNIFGTNPVVYSLIGLIFGVATLTAMWFLVNKLFKRKTAIIAVLLLSTSPLFLANTLFSLIDFLLACLILIALTLYIFDKKTWLALVLCLAVMTKETSLLLPCSIAVVEIGFFLNSWRITRKRPDIKKLLLQLLSLIIPVFLFLSWMQYLKINNQGVWNDWIFTQGAEQGTFAVIMHNLVSLEFLNKYAYQNWLQLFVLNFNWIIFSVTILGTFFYLWRLRKSEKLTIHKLMVHTDIRVKTSAVMIVFFIAYALTVLSFQTYTITRYGLPLIPLTLIFYAKALFEITRRHLILEIIALIVVATISLLSLYSSIDPVSKQIWGTEDIAGETMFSLHKALSGNDGLVYNLQAMIVAGKRSNAVYKANTNGTAIQSKYCNWMLPDINNDSKIFKIFMLEKIKTECIRPD